jgi:hypothetical protein
MKRLSLLVLVLVAGMIFPLAAPGAEVKSCGDYLGYTNLRERGTTCATARRVAHAEWVYPHGIGATHELEMPCRGPRRPLRASVREGKGGNPL